MRYHSTRLLPLVKKTAQEVYNKGAIPEPEARDRTPVARERPFSALFAPASLRGDFISRGSNQYRRKQPAKNRHGSILLTQSLILSFDSYRAPRPGRAPALVFFLIVGSDRESINAVSLIIREREDQHDRSRHRPRQCHHGFGAIQPPAPGRTLLNYGVVPLRPYQSFQRLDQSYSEIKEPISPFQPDAIAIEELFFNTNITTGISWPTPRVICGLLSGPAARV